MTFLLVLDINGWFIVAIIAVIIIVIFNLFTELKNAQFENKQQSVKEVTKQLEYEGVLREKELINEKIQSEMKVMAQNIAITQFEKWKTEELDVYKKKADTAAEFTSKLILQRWLIENESRIRKDAANRSVRNVMGKVAEHLIPFSEAFSEFNPKDARFIGSPIDLIVFDGAEEKKEEITIFFLEVKTGTSVLSPRQKKIMEAVQSKRVEWRRLTITDFGSGVNDLLLPAPE